MLDVKIKEFKMIALADKENLDYMLKMEEAYKLTVDNYAANEEYVKIANQVYKLRKAQAKAEALQAAIAAKEAARIEKELAAAIAERSAQEAKDKYEAIRNASEMGLQEIIDTYNFHMSSTGGLLWYYQPLTTDAWGNREWKSLKRETLLANFDKVGEYIRGNFGEADFSGFREFCKLLTAQSRTFTEVAQSYKDLSGRGVLNIMNTHFCEPAADGSTDYHWMIDALQESLSGGKLGDEDSFEHMRQIIFSKYLYPDNPFLPGIFRNDKGSSGKGLESNRFLPTLFCGNVIDNCNIEHLTGKFNGAIAGKAVIVINETARDKVDVEKVKAFMGSPTFLVENKFEKPYMCDNTALIISATNQKTGGITLSGENSDRRFSIFSTKEDIYHVVQRYMAVKEGKEMTLKDVQNWIENEGQYILEDPVQVGKWINAMAVKYGDCKNVRANNASDAYKAMINRQRPAWTKTVEEVFTDDGFVYIRDQLLRELVMHFNKGEKFIPGRNKFHDEVERMCTDLGIDVVFADRVTIKPSGTTGFAAAANTQSGNVQRSCWIKRVGGVVSKTVHEDESVYGYRNDRENWVWKWVA
jgi:hypothetical protein